MAFLWRPWLLWRLANCSQSFQGGSGNLRNAPGKVLEAPKILAVGETFFPACAPSGWRNFFPLSGPSVRTPSQDPQSGPPVRTEQLFLAAAALQNFFQQLFLAPAALLNLLQQLFQVRPRNGQDDAPGETA